MNSLRHKFSAARDRQGDVLASNSVSARRIRSVLYKHIFLETKIHSLELMINNEYEKN